MRVKLLVLLLCLLSLSCARKQRPVTVVPTSDHYTRAATTNQQASADLYACEKEALDMREESSAARRLHSYRDVGGTVTRCMEAKGYEYRK